VNSVEALYDKYFHDVYLYLKSLTRSDDLAEELTQETFFKAMKSTSQYRGDCDIRVWLCQIAKNTFFTAAKKSKRTTDDEIPETIADNTVSIEDSLIDKSQVMEIHKILHNMEPTYKEVFTLRVFGELSFSQIGEIFEKTESWARVTFHRAKLKIINEMEE
jgi:RNA polymerase sigma-70 factor (ECF subfamily)